jgi:hypothetical protein
MPIIGFTGYAGSGKDTAAQVLIADGWTRRAFADPLKEHVAKRFLFIRQMVEEWGWDVAKSLYPIVRTTLQDVGMEKREEDPDYWVKLAQVDLPDRAVFTDVRFPNEVDAVKSLGGIVVRVERPGVGPVNDHISDTGIDALPVDFVIYNDGTVAGLHERVLAIAGIVA